MRPFEGLTAEGCDPATLTWDESDFVEYVTCSQDNSGAYQFHYRRLQPLPFERRSLPGPLKEPAKGGLPARRRGEESQSGRSYVGEFTLNEAQLEEWYELIDLLQGNPSQTRLAWRDKGGHFNNPLVYVRGEDIAPPDPRFPDKPPPRPNFP